MDGVTDIDGIGDRIGFGTRATQVVWAPCVILFFGISTFAVASPGIHFNQDRYEVAANSSFDLQILIDADDSTSRNDPLTHGLFSYGVLVKFDPANAEVAATTVPPPLQHFGFDAGPFEQQFPGSVGVKGNVNRLVDPIDAYAGNLLATVSLTNLARPSSAYEISLSLFRTLGPTEQVFIDGSGRVLDSALGFTSSVVVVQGGVLGDLDLDGQLSTRDIDLLCEAIRNPGDDLSADFNGDQRVDEGDLEHWVHEISQSFLGDVNLDGEFNATDLLEVFAVGEYDDDVPRNSTWVEGDWNCDGDFNSDDLLVAFQAGGYDQGRRAGTVSSVPEPTASTLMLMCLTSLVIATRQVVLGGKTRRCLC